MISRDHGFTAIEKYSVDYLQLWQGCTLISVYIYQPIGIGQIIDIKTLIGKGLKMTDSRQEIEHFIFTDFNANRVKNKYISINCVVLCKLFYRLKVNQESYSGKFTFNRLQDIPLKSFFIFVLFKYLILINLVLWTSIVQNFFLIGYYFNFVL